jgi:hypothetical protein
MAPLLPQDERRLLAGYYVQIGDTGKDSAFRTKHLCEWLHCRWRVKRIPEYEDDDTPYNATSDEALKRDIKIYIRDSKRVQFANKILAERGLIKHSQDQPEAGVTVVTLSLEGYDLGRRYSSLLGSTGIWFEEYKNHWLWLVVAFMGAAFASKLIEFVANLVFIKPAT